MLNIETYTETFTADAILSISEKNPERLFGRDPQNVTPVYHALTKLWHPDRNKSPQATNVFQHITLLKAKAAALIEANAWHEPGVYKTMLTDGRKLTAVSNFQFDFELGTAHIGTTAVTYVVKHKFEKFAKYAVEFVKNINFADARMMEAYRHSLPTEIRSYEATDGIIIIIRKKPDDVRLKDLIPHIPKDKLQAHAAWIGSRLHEMVRYLDYAKITHGNITSDTVFVSPSQHSIGLFGGWFYATPFKSKITTVPVTTLPFLTRTKDVLSDGSLDRAMIRPLICEVLGDKNGTNLLKLGFAPALVDHLRTPSCGNAQKDLELWSKVLDTLGPRRFTELSVKYENVYPRVV
jgi:hypothetical protein